ncbi:MAG: type II secretion system minor pseudopilin GspI [Halieaceae bacterium]
MRSRGFTLVEVMVALMVIAIALPALLKALYQQIDGTAYLRDKSVAQWVANNKLAENRIQLARNGRLVLGERLGVETMAGRDWYWWILGEATEVEDFYRLQITVALAEEDAETPLYTLIGYIAAQNTVGGRP